MDVVLGITFTMDIVIRRLAMLVVDVMVLRSDEL